MSCWDCVYWEKRIKKEICFVVLFLFFFSYLVSADDDYVNEVEVEHQDVFVDQQFEVRILCRPVTFVKAFECKLVFDYTILRANSVVEGGFFGDYDVFKSPNMGIIDNHNGTIRNIYELILGQGNVSSDGVLFIVNFTAMKTGTAFVMLEDVNLTNETQNIESLSVQSTVIAVVDAPEPEPPTPEPEPPTPEPEPPTSEPEPPTPEPEMENNITSDDDEGEAVEDITGEKDGSFPLSITDILIIVAVSWIINLLFVKKFLL